MAVVLQTEHYANQLSPSTNLAAFEPTFESEDAETCEDRLERARELYWQGRYEELVAELLSGADRTLNSRARELLVRAYADQGQFTKALECCDRALEIDKLNPLMHYLKATILQAE